MPPTPKPTDVEHATKQSPGSNPGISGAGGNLSMIDGCKFEGCRRQISAYGYCSGHRQQFAAGKDLTPLTDRKRRLGCAFPDCSREHYAKKFCQYHARQLRDGKSMTPAPRWRAAASWKTSAEKRTDVETGKRWCTACMRYLPPPSFGVNNGTSDKIDHRCMKCAGLARFNITSLEYEKLLESQEGVCKICRLTNAGGRSLAVDHDHECCPQQMKSCGNCIRGLLCHSCNTAIGHLRDSAELCSRAAEYLRGNTLDREAPTIRG